MNRTALRLLGSNVMVARYLHSYFSMARSAPKLLR